ncbi:MAG: hypothetical protein L0Y67_01950, partial [Gammaproteobacteria bacterium]|nr:hypothetical protein [Gammaproteobacteria bacterium]
MTIEAERKRQRFALLRRWAGYILFAVAIVYAVHKAPPETWQMDPIWVSLAALLFLVQLLLQVVQFNVFLHHHGVRFEWGWPTLFTTRKAIL